MPETSNEFSLFLARAPQDAPTGDASPSAITVSNVLSHTSDAVRRLGQLADSEDELVLTVRGFRRGSLILPLAIELLDNLGRASPTTHVFVCSALLSAFGLMAKKLYQSALAPPTTSKEDQLAEQALEDDQFKLAIGSAFEAALSDRNSQIIGISRFGSDKPEIELPAGYFQDTSTGLALPRGIFEYEERIFRKSVPITISGPLNGDYQRRQIYWTEGRQLVQAPSSIVNPKLLRRADNLPRTPIAVADLEIDVAGNSATRQFRYRSVSVRKARLL